jgi:hypothetical protein
MLHELRRAPLAVVVLVILEPLETQADRLGGLTATLGAQATTSATAAAELATGATADADHVVEGIRVERAVRGLIRLLHLVEFFGVVLVVVRHFGVLEDRLRLDFLLGLFRLFLRLLLDLLHLFLALLLKHDLVLLEIGLELDHEKDADHDRVHGERDRDPRSVAELIRHDLLEALLLLPDARRVGLHVNLGGVELLLVHRELFFAAAKVSGLSAPAQVGRAFLALPALRRGAGRFRLWSDSNPDPIPQDRDRSLSSGQVARAHLRGSPRGPPLRDWCTREQLRPEALGSPGRPSAQATRTCLCGSAWERRRAKSLRAGRLDGTASRRGRPRGGQV